ncbi:MAG TPA: hypothetical protein VGM05_10105 [Planctomycetaceae bacterium]|jgi:hypothetical protein
MNLREISPAARLISGAVSYVATVAVAVWMLGVEAWWLLAVVAIALAAAVSPFLGAAVVWFIVRRANRRHDPQPVDPLRGQSD